MRIYRPESSLNASSVFTEESVVEPSSPLQQLSNPTPYTAPGHLRAAAHLYGIETVPLEKARVLELGCETAGNLLPFALTYPSAQVVGVDLWQENIQQGEKMAQCLNAQNVTLHNKPFTEIDKSFGEFDYIIVHDQFTWAPSVLREAILRICRENLSPLGIAYVSYNTYPGWKAGDILRDAMQLHNHSASSMEEVLAGAEAMLLPMSDGLASNNPQTASLKAAVNKISKHLDYYINSEFLQATTSSFYFIELAEATTQAGLAYVGDAEPQDEISATHGRNVQLNHSLITLGQPKIMKQQYLDFAVGRAFRKSLFVHQERAASILSTPDLTRFADLNWAASLKQGNFSTAEGKPANFLNISGSAIAVTAEAAIRICNVLAGIWPMSISHKDLIAAARNTEAWLEPEKTEQNSEDIQHALETLFKMGILHYSLGAGPYDSNENNVLQAFTKIENLTQSDSAENAVIHSFNFWHMPITLHLKHSQIRLLQAINSERITKQLLTPALQNSELESKEKSTALLSNEPDLINNTNTYGTELVQLIDPLRTQGVLLGSSTAWLDFFKTMLSSDLLPSRSRLEYLRPYLQHLKRVAQQSLKTSTSAKAIKQIQTRIDGVPEFKHKPEAIDTFNRIQELRKQQRFSEAEPLAYTLATNYPKTAIGWHLLSIILGEMGETEERLSPLLKALSLQPENTAIYTSLSVVLIALKEEQHAEEILRYALEINPQEIANWLNLGNILRSQYKTSLAEICCRNALLIDPKNPEALTNLSTVLGDQGRLTEAIDCLRKVVSAQPDNHLAHSNLLFLLSHLEDITPNELFKEHRVFGKRLESGKSKQVFVLKHPNLRNPQKILRVGFVSGDLCSHAVASFLEPIWASINKQDFELYAYSNTPIEDNVSLRLKTHVKNWSKIRSLSDQDLAKQIQIDEIDILFDLSGHTGHNRLPMFALKPAPIQISWIGYSGTTGLTTMDYYLVDKFFAPPGLLDEQFTEKLARLPAIAVFQPAPNCPEINMLPALTTGHLTFGSFNRLSKITENVLSLWSQVLHAIPDSKLLLGHLHGHNMAQEVISRFQKYQINADRLILRERTSMQEYLQYHHHVDLLLDTFPYTGGTTSNHGLWMGVPTLTLSGKTLANRQGVCILSHVQLGEFIAETPEKFVENAISWSKKLPELAQIRQEMRARVEASHIYSYKSVTQGLESTLRYMWKLWCADEPARSFDITENKP